jgi:hypothetical protein
MVKKQSRKAKGHVPKTVLRLPDLDQAKSAVLNSLSSLDAQRGYRHAIARIHGLALRYNLQFVAPIDRRKCLGESPRTMIAHASPARRQTPI